MSAQTAGPQPLAAKLAMFLFQTVAVTIAGIVAATVVTNVIWRLTPVNELDILVYDQSVPDDTYPEHAALGQIFEYHRVPYDVASDYVGAAPGGGSFGEWPSTPPDMVILADTYGVYYNDQGEPDELGRALASGRLSQAQAADVKAWADGGVPTYGEFSLVLNPTPAAAGLLLEETFGFVSTGWIIQPVEDLAALSPALRDLGPHPWPYSGPGLIAVNTWVAGREGSNQIIVLTEDQMTDLMPTVLGGPPNSGGSEALFAKWMSYVNPVVGSSVDAWFELPVNDDGAALLAEAGIPTRIPALIRGPNTLYFAGDGLEDETPFRLRRLRGGAVFTRLITGEEFRFLYQVLEPSMAWLIEIAEQNKAQDLLQAEG